MERMGQSQKWRIYFVQFARWRHWVRSLHLRLHFVWYCFRVIWKYLGSIVAVQAPDDWPLYVKNCATSLLLLKFLKFWPILLVLSHHVRRFVIKSSIKIPPEPHLQCVSHMLPEISGTVLTTSGLVYGSPCNIQCIVDFVNLDLRTINIVLMPLPLPHKKVSVNHYVFGLSISHVRLIVCSYGQILLPQHLINA